MRSVIVEYRIQCGLSVCHLLSLNVKDGGVSLVTQHTSCSGFCLETQ